MTAVGESRARALLFAAAFLRAAAVGMTGVLLALHLSVSGLDSARIGIVVSVGLAGCAAGTALATLFADRFGARRSLLLLALGGAAGTAAVALSPPQPLLLLAAFAGMVNGMGRDRGASLVVEQAWLAGLAPPAGRTRSFALYHFTQDAGHALGAAAAGLPAIPGVATAIGEPAALRAALLLAALLLAVSIPLYARLPAPAGDPAGSHVVPLSPGVRRLLVRISALFALDGLGGGFLTTSLVGLLLHERFGAGTGAIAALFATARVANALSHLAAAWLALRIGLVRTMVFTHVPSSLLLVTVAFAPSFPVAAVLFLLREGLVEMDVPTRQSFVMAVVPPEARTRVAGVTHLVRLASWAVAPAAAGWLMRDATLVLPLLVGAVLKLVYDLLLYLAFRRVRPEEERDRAAVPGTTGSAGRVTIPR